MSCIKHPRGVKLCTGCGWGGWELKEQREKKVASALRGSRHTEEWAGGRLRKISDRRPWVTAESEAQGG